MPPARLRPLSCRSNFRKLGQGGRRRDRPAISTQVVAQVGRRRRSAGQPPRWLSPNDEQAEAMRFTHSHTAIDRSRWSIDWVHSIQRDHSVSWRTNRLPGHSCTRARHHTTRRDCVNNEQINGERERDQSSKESTADQSTAKPGEARRSEAPRSQPTTTPPNEDSKKARQRDRKKERMHNKRTNNKPKSNTTTQQHNTNERTNEERGREGRTTTDRQEVMLTAHPHTPTHTVTE